jgi:cytochrome c biogenesis protein ResB
MVEIILLGQSTKAACTHIFSTPEFWSSMKSLQVQGKCKPKKLMNLAAMKETHATQSKRQARANLRKEAMNKETVQE